MTRLQHARTRHDHETGSMALFMTGLSVALMLLIALMWDGNTRMRAAHLAITAAGEAGRAATQAISDDAIGGTNADIDPAKGAAAARSYLAQAGVHGTVTVSGQRVIITTSVPWTPQFIPVPAQDMTGRAEAVTVRP